MKETPTPERLREMMLDANRLTRKLRTLPDPWEQPLDRRLRIALDRLAGTIDELLGVSMAERRT